MKGNSFYTFLVWEIQLILQQYRAVTTILAIFIWECMEKVSAYAACESVHINDLLYLQGIVVHSVVSFTQLDHTLGCSVLPCTFSSHVISGALRD